MDRTNLRKVRSKRFQAKIAWEARRSHAIFYYLL